MAAVALLVALAAATVGADGFVQASHARSQIDVLRAGVRSLESRVRAADRGAASERVSIAAVEAQAAGARRSLKHLSWQLENAPTETEIARVRGKLTTYASCLSQLQREIAGLGIVRTTDPAKSVGYAELFTKAPVSRSCSAALSGR